MSADVMRKIDIMEAEIALLKAKLATPVEKPAIRTVMVGDLEWQADVPADRFTWKEAKAYATSLGDGWRLPTVAELVSQFDYDLGKPKDVSWRQDWYWASSPLSGNTAYAGLVYFYNGDTYHYDVGVSIRVRCVR